MSYNNKKDIMSAITNTLTEVQDLLAKSSYMAKDDQNPEMQDEMGAAPEADAGMEGAPEASDGLEGAPEADAGMEGEQSPEDAAAQDTGAEDPSAELREQAAQLSDEELDQMIDVLMAEKQSRQGGEEGAAPEAEAAPAEAPAPDAAEKSMKSEFAQLAKSVTQMADAIGKLSKDVSEIKTGRRIATKPAASNKPTRTLEKSAPAMKRLTKSESLTFLEGEVRKGNRLVTRDVVAEVNLAKTERELADIQDKLALEGIAFPTK